jgi:hypothetical protein
MWRRVCLVIIVVIAAWCVYATYFASLAYGDWGARPDRLGFSADTRVFTVGRIEPGSPAARAGIVAGDRLRGIVPHAFTLGSPKPGTRVDFEVTHGSSRRIVTLVAEAKLVPRHPSETILFVFEMTILGLAFLLAWRRWNDRDARPLILYFTCEAATMGASAFPFASSAIVWATFDLTIFLGSAGLLRFTSIYPSNAPSSKFRRTFAIVAPAVAVATGVVWFVGDLSGAWLNVSFLGGTWQDYADLAFFDVLRVVALLAGFSGAHGADRKRLTLLLIFFVAGATGPVAFNILLANGLPFWEVRPLLATLIVTALGFVYMIFQHRMFDLGFVLNRAAVYAVISTLLVPLLLFGEWLAQGILTGGSRTENAVVQVGIALLLFVVARQLYDRIDRVIDRLLFRERHENEDALRNFARRVTLVDDAQTIGEQAVQAVCAHTDAAWAALYRRDASGDYALSSRRGEPRIPALAGRNDPAVLTLRADRSAVDNLRDSDFADALILPMIGARGLGEFFVCGPKRSGESYAPDERDALLQLAHGVAVAFDTVHIGELENEVAHFRSAPRAAT